MTTEVKTILELILGDCFLQPPLPLINPKSYLTATPAGHGFHIFTYERWGERRRCGGRGVEEEGEGEKERGGEEEERREEKK